MEHQEYVKLDWPESQPFIGKKGCIECDEASVLVPKEKYLKKKGTSRAVQLLADYQELKKSLLAFIEKNVPEQGITLKKEEIDTDECRVLVTEHFTGEPTLVNVTKIYPYCVEGKDSYGNELDRISLQTDCSLDAVYDIARFLIYYRKKTRV